MALVLKGRNAAIRDGDNVLAVIKSTEVMHGGKSQGLVSPNVNTQVALQKSLLRKAGLQPSQIEYVLCNCLCTTSDAIDSFLETHGTGQPSSFVQKSVH